jgi:serine/threonine protein kinase
VEWVLRCYDNRFQETERKPNFYLEFARDDEMVGTTVLRVFDSTPQEAYPLGVVSERTKEKSAKYSWMWKAHGQLHIIRTPYWPGRHVASCPLDFLSIILELQELHLKGYVHGDIRCYNIVFNGNLGRLIDFDYSGMDTVIKYPRDYNNVLSDGIRQRPTRKRKSTKSDDTVPKWHDWFALGHIILSLHVFKVPENCSDSTDLLIKGEKARQDLSNLKSDNDTPRLIASLEALLNAHTKAGSECSPYGTLLVKEGSEASPSRSLQPN